MNITEAIALFEKAQPVVEAILAQMQPLVEKEILDGHNLWSSVDKAITDLREAVDGIDASLRKAK